MSVLSTGNEVFHGVLASECRRKRQNFTDANQSPETDGTISALLQSFFVMSCNYISGLPSPTSGYKSLALRSSYLSTTRSNRADHLRQPKATQAASDIVLPFHRHVHPAVNIPVCGVSRRMPNTCNSRIQWPQDVPRMLQLRIQGLVRAALAKRGPSTTDGWTPGSY